MNFNYWYKSLNEFFLDNNKWKMNDKRLPFVLGVGRIGYTSIIGKFNEKLYGMSPDFSVEKVKNELINSIDSPLLFKSAFDNYISENQEYWIDDDKCNASGSIGLALFKKCVLAMVHEFKVRIFLKIYDTSLRLLERLLLENKVYYYLDKNGTYVDIFGRLSNEQIQVLEQYFIVFSNEKGLNIILPKTDIIGKQVHWSELHKYLYCNEMFYSGVLTNLSNIELKPINEANKNIRQIVLTISMTTYATVLGLGHPKLSSEEGFLYKKYYLKEHPYLSDCIEELNTFDKAEFEMQSVLLKNVTQSNDFEGEEYFRNISESINDYLRKSDYPHIVSIAGSIISSDDYYVYVKRGSKGERANLLSCTVTGYSEVYDSRVKFYDNSFSSDKPTIINNDGYFDFTGEFSREAYAELNIPSKNEEWKTSGILVSMRLNTGKDSEYYRQNTVDFEVVGEIKVSQNIDSIIGNAHGAIEEHENSELRGIKFNIFDDLLEKAINSIRNIPKTLMNYKDIIIILSIILLNRNNIITGAIDWYFKSVNQGIPMTSIFSGLKIDIESSFNLLIVVLFISDIVKHFKEKRIKQVQNIYLNRMKVEDKKYRHNYHDYISGSGKNTSNVVSSLYAILTQFHIVSKIDKKNRMK